jgi:hypothetical protein
LRRSSVKHKDLYEAVAKECQAPLPLVVKIVKAYKKARHAAIKAEHEKAVAKEITQLAHDIVDGVLS